MKKTLRQLDNFSHILALYLIQERNKESVKQNPAMWECRMNPGNVNFFFY